MFFHLTALLEKTEDGAYLGYSAFLNLDMRRTAYIRAIDKSGSFPVWTSGAIIGASRRTFRALTLEKLDALVTDFAADYYKAGNP
jgi:hypothetical protein